MAKTGFEDVIIGMSGGIDSTVATTLAVDALGPEHVYGVSLPSTITSDASIEDAREVAETLGIELDVVPVGGAVETLESTIESATDETVAVRATVTGTHSESLMDLSPTGESFEIAYAWFCRIEDGLTAEIWSLPDGLGLLKQLEAIPDEP
jgi:NH3-dependent NAD+ synthetase